MKFVNPTALGIRNDAGGSGFHGAPRGKRLHDGVDFACEPGQDILMPVDGAIARESLPYKDDLSWRGIYIVNPRIEIKIWYLKPRLGIIGNTYKAGTVIGTAQDIGKKYRDVTPHVHVRIVKIDPLFLFDIDTEDYNIDAV